MFGSNMDKINRNLGLKMESNGQVCPYLTQTWIETAQHFLECNSSIFFKLTYYLHFV